jgi:hypothetical protein
MASIWLKLAADGAATFMTALNARAAIGEPGDQRTADQRRRRRRRRHPSCGTVTVS